MQLNDRIKIKTALLSGHISAKPTPSKAITIRLQKNPDNKKLLSELAYYSPEAGTRHHESSVESKKKKFQPAPQLATFSSKKLMSSVTSFAKDSHETRLKKELSKFRSEVEVKYKGSQISNGYQFPRPLIDPLDTSSDEEKASSTTIFMTLNSGCCPGDYQRSN